MCELEKIFHLKYTLMATKVHITGREWSFLTISKNPSFFDQLLDNRLLKATNYCKKIKLFISSHWELKPIM